MWLTVASKRLKKRRSQFEDRVLWRLRLAVPEHARTFAHARRTIGQSLRGDIRASATWRAQPSAFGCARWIRSGHDAPPVARHRDQSPNMTRRGSVALPALTRRHGETGRRARPVPRPQLRPTLSSVQSEFGQGSSTTHRSSSFFTELTSGLTATSSSTQACRRLAQALKQLPGSAPLAEPSVLGIRLRRRSEDRSAVLELAAGH
jgi:hypothetical protein